MPAVAEGEAELDCFDFIEDLKIADGPLLTLLTATSLHGGLVDTWALLRRTAKSTVDCLVERWRREGLPTYAQFDNDTVFQGAHQFPDAIGRVSRLCLALGVIPLFAPPREPGFKTLSRDSTVSGRPNSGNVSIAAAKETCNNIPTVTLPPIAPATPNAASRPQSANPSRYTSPSTPMCLCAVRSSTCAAPMPPVVLNASAERSRSRLNGCIAWFVARSISLASISNSAPCAAAHRASNRC